MKGEKIDNYSKIALEAYFMIVNDKKEPQEAWKESAKEIFPDSKSSQEKPCPKSAFLGLCEEGILINIQSGDYTRSIKNKNYAIQALKILQNNYCVKSPIELWNKIDSDANNHNHQMDVVFALYQNNLINWKNLK